MGYLDNLWTRSRTIEFDEIPVRVLSPEDTLIHLCVHLATHVVERQARLVQGLDVARFVRGSVDSLDWEYIIQAAKAARVARFVYLALSAVHRLCDAPLPAEPVMQKLGTLTPARLRAYAEEDSADDLMRMDFRRVDLGRAYRLTFGAAESTAEKIGVLRFALFPPLDASSARHHAEPSAFAPILYARHIADRTRAYLGSLARDK